MRTVLATTFAVGALLLSSLATADHQMLTSSAKVKVLTPTTGFCAGAKFAVIDGDRLPRGWGTIRLLLPAGYEIAPHWYI